MGFLARGIERKSDPLKVWAEMLRAGTTSKSGQTVNLDTAFRVAVFFACLRVLAQGVAQVPFKLFQEMEANGLKKIEPARDHPAYDVITTAPNDWTTSFEFRETMVIHAAAMGDAYAWKNMGPRGDKLRELILLDPARMELDSSDEYEQPVFKYTGKDGKQAVFAPETIWHLRGPSWNGFSGLPMLQIARDALGVTMALDESVAKLHANGVRPSGMYSVDKVLSDQQHKQVTSWLQRNAAEPGSPLILDNGAKWVAQVMSSVDAQHLEMRKHQIEEVCRFTGVSPFMVFHTDKAPTYASAEQFQIQHVVHTLAAWYARIEQSADLSLLSKKERQAGLYFKFNAAGLLRGAMKDQGEFFARMMGAGGTRQIMTQDEIRALMELNPMGGDAAILHAPQGSNSDPQPA